MDAHYGQGLGYDISQRFGSAGELTFVLFLCACKRSYPQGHIRYRTDDEAMALMGIHFPLVDNSGDKWFLDDLWKWLRYRRVVSTSRRADRALRGSSLRMVRACKWDAWEMSAALDTHAEQKRRSRAQKRPTNVGHVQNDMSDECPAEVGGGRKEVGGGSARGESASGAPGPQHAGEGLQQLINRLEPKTKPKKPPAKQ
jgi:hypothetical protein